MGDDGQCRNILVDVVVECSVSVDGVSLDSTGQYMSANISVRHYPNRVRISVPNCDTLTLEMFLFCESRTMDDPESPTGRVTTDMITFNILRGFNVEHSYGHGLIGKL